MSSWDAVATEGGEVDLHDAGLHYALDVLGRTVFGEPWRSGGAEQDGGR